MFEVRSIDANCLKSWVKKECNPYGNPTIGSDDGRRFMEQIDKMPTLEPEVVHGRWVMNNPYGIKCCSVCGYGQSIGAENYCPNCGAKMDGGTDND